MRVALCHSILGECGDIFVKGESLAYFVQAYAERYLAVLGGSQKDSLMRTSDVSFQSVVDEKWPIISLVGGPRCGIMRLSNQR